ncbi:MAG: hypothetical protein HXK07_02705 [Actinomyces sp.]|nr:hypothetical protein [Actinomyces sp.]
MRIRQHLQCVIVLSIDDRVEGLVSTSLDPTGLHKSGVDAIPELCDNHHVVNNYRLGLGLLGIQLSEVCHALSIDKVNPRHSPQPLVSALGLPTRRKHPHLVTATHRPAGQLDSLRLMLLEDETEAATLGESGELGFQISTELRINLACLP